MKHLEHYSKYKTSYPSAHPIFFKVKWWLVVLITFMAALTGPLVVYNHQKSAPLSFAYYLRMTEYFLLIVVPFIILLVWANWREAIKRKRAYFWSGKFEVIGKRSWLIFCYLLLTPGDDHKLKVDRDLFEKTRVGEFILIRRDALGRLEGIVKFKNFPNRLGKG